MAAVPIYVWNGTAWQETGPTIPASPIKYQASAPSSPSTGDIWVDSDADVDSGSQQFQRFRFVASGGETTISGADANGATLAYTAGAELVVLNGSTLVRGQDYTATNGTTISGLSPALVANDVLEVFSFIAFSVANTYTQSQVDGFISAANAQPGMKLIVPTSVSGGTVNANGSVTFSGTTGVALNGVFSSTYRNYRVLIRITSASASTTIPLMYLRNGTTDKTTSYTYGIYGRQISSGGVVSASGNTTGIYMQDLYNSGVFAGYTYDIIDPFESIVTVALGQHYIRASDNQYYACNTGTVQNDNYSADGLNLTTSAGSATLSGTISVYGYKY
jgi:hypothetical protein